MVNTNALQSVMIVIFGVPLIILILILALPQLAGINLVDSTQSANLTSLGTSTSELLPWFGILAITGVILIAVRGR